jgi:cytochrome c oxidase assembly protein subunit 15
MNADRMSSTTLQHRPLLAWFAAAGSVWVFVLVTLGAFTTSIGAGMVFLDWPLSNGSINPDGWLTDVAMFAEHSHRLSGATMGLITIALAVWLWRAESRRWLRNLGWWALAIVVIQGLIGGKRVLLDATHVPGFEMSLGQMLRIPHGILAQVFVCILFAIAVGLSRRWIEAPARNASGTIRALAVAGTVLMFGQLIIAATMRHNAAGMAIPTFPLTPEGGLVPTSWDFRVGIHFAHRAMALVLTFVLGTLAIAIWRSDATAGLKRAATAMTLLLVVQVALGAASIWTMRNPYYTTAHVIVGACLLASVFTLMWWTHRGSIDGVRVSATRESTPARSAVLERA